MVTAPPSAFEPETPPLPERAKHVSSASSQLRSLQLPPRQTKPSRQSALEQHSSLQTHLPSSHSSSFLQSSLEQHWFLQTHSPPRHSSSSRQSLLAQHWFLQTHVPFRSSSSSRQTGVTTLPVSPPPVSPPPPPPPVSLPPPPPLPQLRSMGLAGQSSEEPVQVA